MMTVAVPFRKIAAVVGFPRQVAAELVRPTNVAVAVERNQLSGNNANQKVVE